MVVSILLITMLQMHPHEHGTLLTNPETPKLALSPFSHSRCPNFVGTPHSIEI
jgi:hypothetical protein